MTPSFDDASAASPHVSIVVPVYNEEDNLEDLYAQVVRAMDRQPRSWDLWLVDDGSTDASLARIRDLAGRDARVRYLALSRNTGQSAAFAAGFREAPGRIFVTLDADLQNDPADIPAMLDIYDRGNEVVAGWRVRRRDSCSKRWASRLANAVRNGISRESVHDTGCSLKVLRADMARQLPMFTGMHRFLPTLMRMRGARVAEVQVNHRPRVRGTSKYGIWDRAIPAFLDLLAVRWMQKRSFLYDIKERR